MRRLVAMLLGGVPLCPSTERAIAATLADWRHEAGRTLSAAVRIGVSARYGVALARAVVGSALRQVPREVRSPFLWRLAVTAVLAIGLLAWLNPAPARVATGAFDHAWLSVLQATWLATMFVLLVVFVSEATGRPFRSAPSLTGGLMLAAALFGFTFVVLPEAINHFAMRAWEAVYWTGRADGLPPMVSPIRLLTGEPTQDLSWAYVSFGGLNWLGLSMAAWSFSVLAYRVRQYGGAHRVRRFLIVWSTILAVFLLVVAIRLIDAYSGARVDVPLSLLHLMLSVGALVASSWLARRARVSTHGSEDSVV
jgi:hypothetical protein